MSRRANVWLPKNKYATKNTTKIGSQHNLTDCMLNKSQMSYGDGVGKSIAGSKSHVNNALFRLREPLDEKRTTTGKSHFRRRGRAARSPFVKYVQSDPARLTQCRREAYKSLHVQTHSPDGSWSSGVSSAARIRSFAPLCRDDVPNCVAWWKLVVRPPGCSTRGIHRFAGVSSAPGVATTDRLHGRCIPSIARDWQRFRARSRASRLADANQGSIVRRPARLNAWPAFAANRSARP